jgi:hypothetical protein
MTLINKQGDKMKTKKWQSLLSKKEMKHLRWCLMGHVTLANFKKLRESQISDEKEFGIICLCWDCRVVGRKLIDGGKI